MRVLVTGGSGYLGSRYVAAFAADPDVEDVVNVDVRPLGAAVPKTRTVLRSVTEDLADVMTGVDVVIHNVWVVDPLRDARRQREICIGGTRSVLAACAAAGVPHVVFISSDTAYGAHPGPQVTHDEREPLRAGFRYQYADEKREAEGLVARFAEEHPGVLVQVVRPATVWGPNVRNYIARMMAKPIVWLPLGYDPGIQLLHERDIGPALHAIVRSRLPGPFNIAATDAVPLSEVVRIVRARTFPLPKPLLVLAAEVAFRLGWRWLSEAPGGFAHFFSHNPVLGTRRLREEVGYTPRFTTRQALEEWAAARA